MPESAEPTELSVARLTAADDPQIHWYAAYTCVHREKRVAEFLRAKAIPHFLPLCEEVHRWVSGPVRLQIPLFPGYVFVRLALADELQVLTVPGVVRLVGSGTGPSALPDQDIAAIREALLSPLCIRPHRYLIAGQKVMIINGPMRGLHGILLRHKNQTRVVVSLELIMRSIVADIDAADCAPVQSSALQAVRNRTICAAA